MDTQQLDGTEQTTTGSACQGDTEPLTALHCYRQIEWV